MDKRIILEVLVYFHTFVSKFNHILCIYFIHRILQKTYTLYRKRNPNIVSKCFASKWETKFFLSTGKGDSIGAIETRKYLIRTQDSLNNAFSSNQLDQIKDIYHIDELLLEKQKVTNINYVRIFVILLILSILALILSSDRPSSRHSSRLSPRAL